MSSELWNAICELRTVKRFIVSKKILGNLYTSGRSFLSVGTCTPYADPAQHLMTAGQDQHDLQVNRDSRS